MLGRFSPLDLFRGHFRGLSDYREVRTTPDHLAQLSFVILPAAAGVCTLIWGKLAAPGPLLTGIALLAGGFLSAFTHLSTLRLRLTERQETWGDSERFDRDSIDETAAHLLAASYLSGITALLLVVGMNTTNDANGAVTGLWAGLAVASASYVFLLFVVALPKFYRAYLNINSVRPAMSGSHSGRGSDAPPGF